MSSMSSSWRRPWLPPICANRSEWVSCCCRRHHHDAGDGQTAVVRAGRLFVPPWKSEISNTPFHERACGEQSKGWPPFELPAIRIWLAWGDRGNGRKNSEKTPGSPPRTSSTCAPSVRGATLRPAPGHPSILPRCPCGHPLFWAGGPSGGSPHPVQSPWPVVLAPILCRSLGRLFLFGGEWWGGVCARRGLES